MFDSLHRVGVGSVQGWISVNATGEVQCNASTAKYALRCTSKHTLLHFKGHFRAGSEKMKPFCDVIIHCWFQATTPPMPKKHYTEDASFFLNLPFSAKSIVPHLKYCTVLRYRTACLCTAGLSSAHAVLTADTLQIYCSDTASGHGVSNTANNHANGETTVEYNLLNLLWTEKGMPILNPFMF